MLTVTNVTLTAPGQAHQLHADTDRSLASQLRSKLNFAYNIR